MIFKLALLSLAAIVLAHKFDKLCVCDPCPQPSPSICLCPEKPSPFGYAAQRKYGDCCVIEIPSQTCPIPLPCGYQKTKTRKLVVKRPCPVPRPCPKPIPCMPIIIETVPVTPFPRPEAPEIQVEDIAYCCPPNPCDICCCQDPKCKPLVTEVEPECKPECKPECQPDCKPLCKPWCKPCCRQGYRPVCKLSYEPCCEQCC